MRPETENDAGRDSFAAEVDGGAAQNRRGDERDVQSLVAEITRERAELEQGAARLQELADTLRTRARRALKEGGSELLLFSNAHLRLSAAVLQVTRRTTAMDRLLRMAEARKEEARLHEQHQRDQRSARAAARRAKELELPSGDALEELYGEALGGGMTNAE